MEEGENKSTASDADCLPVDYSRLSKMHDIAHVTGKHETDGLKNGYSSSLSLLMSMASDVNRNVSETSLRAHQIASQGSLDNKTPNQASQLLMAAASVVNKASNGMVALPPADSLITSYASFGNTQPGSILSAVTQQFRQDDSTSVSFTARSTMSTGFTTSHALNSNYTDRTMIAAALPPSSVMTSYADENRPELNPSLQHFANKLKVPEPTYTASQTAMISKPNNHKTVSVPYLWKRHRKEEAVQYESPSGESLTSLEEVKRYLLSEETCKCGLTCPFHVEKVFNFDPTYDSKEWEAADIGANSERTVKHCCHRKHITSNALAKRCKTIPKPVKPSPPRRRVQKNSSRTNNRKANRTGNSSGLTNKKVCDILAERHQYEGRSSVMSSVTESRVTPIPPIETVMRSLADTSSGLSNYPPSGNIMTPPRLPADLMSPRVPMLSPHTISPSAGHMVPVIAHTSYPPTHLNGGQQHTPPMYRGAHHEQGMHSPLGHPSFNPGIPGLPPQQHYPATSYDLMQQQLRAWNPAAMAAAHPMAPPHQFSAPMWQPKPEPGTTTPGRKRRRRASSRSSNGGNSDTGYTSELSSPIVTSPGKSRAAAQEKSDNSKQSQPRTSIPETSPPHSSPASKGDTVTSSSTTSITNSSDSSDKPSNVTSTSHTPTLTSPRHPSVVTNPDHHFSRMAQPPTVPPYGFTNGLPYMDPMMQRALPPGYPALPPQPMYIPGVPYGQYPTGPPQLPTQGGQVMRGVYSRPPTDAKSVHVPVVRKTSSSAEAEPSTSQSVEHHRRDTAESLSEQERKQPTSVGGVLKSPDRFVSQSTPSATMNGNPYQQPMLHPGFFPSGMRLPGELLPPHQMSQPVHMMRTPDGQLFYRYASPRMPLPPPIYPGGYGSMYQPPYLSAQSEYESASSISPKRKRRKASSKTVVESNSAILAGSNNQPEDLSTKSAAGKSEPSAGQS